MCARCKTQKTQDKIEIMADSVASDCFTHTQSDLSEFEVLDDKDLVVKTASKTSSLKIKGKGVWMRSHSQREETNYYKSFVPCLLFARLITQTNVCGPSAE